MTLQEKIKEYGEIYQQIKSKKAELQLLQGRKDNLEAEIRHEMEEQGYDKITADNVTVYTRDDVYVSIPKGNEEAINWLVENDLGDILYLYAPSQTLTAYIKEKAEDNPEIWDDVKQLFNVSEKQRVGIRIKR